MPPSMTKARPPALMGLFVPPEETEILAVGVEYLRIEGVFMHFCVADSTAGEDVAFIARRIMICAAEDVSNADPQALVVATSAAQAVERLGMPEARIVLAQAATYVACAPKSNSSIMAIDAAMDLVAHSKTCPIPAHLQDAHYKSAAKLGHGIGYLYSHDYPYHYVKQQYLPDELEGTTFFNLSDNGYEKKIKEHFKEIGKL